MKENISSAITDIHTPTFPSEKGGSLQKYNNQIHLSANPTDKLGINIVTQIP